MSAQFLAQGLRAVGLTVLATFALAGADVSVRLVNRTSGAKPPAGAPVSLSVSSAGGEKQVKPVETDRRGIAHFPNLDVPAGVTLRATTVHRGVKYESDPAKAADPATTVALEVPVYETTSSSSKLVVPFHHTILRSSPGFLQVTEMMVIENRGDRTYIGAGELDSGVRNVFEFHPAGGYTQLSLGEGMMACCIIQRDGKLIDTMEFPPGKRTVQFRYLVPVDGGSRWFHPDFVSRTSHYTLLVSAGAKVAGVTGLAAAGSLNAGGTTLLKYEGSDLGPASEARIQLGGLRGNQQRRWRWIAAAAALLLPLFLLFWSSRRRS